MKRRWTLTWDPSRELRFLGRSDEGTEVIFQTAEGLISFLGSGELGADAIVRALRQMYSAEAGFKVRVELEDSWR